MEKYIYKVTNLINGKVYIGQTNDLKRREREHKNLMYGEADNKIFYQAIKKYGWENFKMEKIEDKTPNYNERENYWIKFYNSMIPNGYNANFNAIQRKKYKQILNSETLQNIINELKNTSLSYDEIAKKYDFENAQSIRNINSGIIYHLTNVTYPIRPTRNQIAHDRAIAVIQDLKNTTSNFNELAKKYNCSSTTISNINTGIRDRQENEQYPIRQSTRTGRKFTENQISAIYADIINTKIKWSELAKKYNCGEKVFQHINQGKLHRRPGYEYPLRKTQQKRGSQKALQIINLLQHSDLSYTEIAEKLNTNTTTIRNINNGSVHYQQGINYPIRENNLKVTCIDYPG